MKAKIKYSPKKNYLTWYEFWHPKKAAALKAEQDLNNRSIAANADQDNLEALMSKILTDKENALKEKQLQQQKEIVIIAVCAFVVFIIVKFV